MHHPSLTNTHPSMQGLTVSLLRALLEHAPTETGRNNVAVDIESCNSPSALRELHDRYLTGLLLPMRAAGGKTPPVSDHPSRRSAMTAQSITEYLIEIAKCDQSVLKDLCLQRDNFRCVITGHIDGPALKQQRTFYSPGDRFERTIAAHIIPLSIAAKSDKPAVIQRMSPLFEILSRFAGIRLDELNGEMINHVENVFTLCISMHDTFGTLNAWLEPVEGKEHIYILRYGPEIYAATAEVPDRTVITFQNATQGIPLPDSRYIAIHAACAKVVHASGAAEPIDQYLRDYESIPALAEDGSSSQLLRYALRMISVAWDVP